MGVNNYRFGMYFFVIVLEFIAGFANAQQGESTISKVDKVSQFLESHLNSCNVTKSFEFMNTKVTSISRVSKAVVSGTGLSFVLASDFFSDKSPKKQEVFYSAKFKDLDPNPTTGKESLKAAFIYYNCSSGSCVEGHRIWNNGPANDDFNISSFPMPDCENIDKIKKAMDFLIKSNGGASLF